jgi:hypothetical protein
MSIIFFDIMEIVHKELALGRPTSMPQVSFCPDGSTSPGNSNILIILGKEYKL